MIRKPVWQGEEFLPEGHSVFLHMVDENLGPIQKEKVMLSVNTLCMNRSLPDDLKTELYFAREQKKMSGVRRLLPFTKCRWPKVGPHANWEILSHLRPNYLSISDGVSGAKAMQEILRIYDLRRSSSGNTWIEGIVHIMSELTTHIKPKIRGKSPGNQLWEGVTTTITVDETLFTGTSLFLFGEMEERYLAGYMPPTGYVQLIIVNQQGKLLYEWQPRAGEQA